MRTVNQVQQHRTFKWRTIIDWYMQATNLEYSAELKKEAKELRLTQHPLCAGTVNFTIQNKVGENCNMSKTLLQI